MRFSRTGFVLMWFSALVLADVALGQDSSKPIRHSTEGTWVDAEGVAEWDASLDLLRDSDRVSGKVVSRKLPPGTVASGNIKGDSVDVQLHDAEGEYIGRFVGTVADGQIVSGGFVAADGQNSKGAAMWGAKRGRTLGAHEQPRPSSDGASHSGRSQ